jgi:hypothetical protein
VSQFTFVRDCLRTHPHRSVQWLDESQFTFVRDCLRTESVRNMVPELSQFTFVRDCLRTGRSDLRRELERLNSLS